MVASCIWWWAFPLPSEHINSANEAPNNTLCLDFSLVMPSCHWLVGYVVALWLPCVMYDGPWLSVLIAFSCYSCCWDALSFLLFLPLVYSRGLWADCTANQYIYIYIHHRSCNVFMFSLTPLRYFWWPLATHSHCLWLLTVFLLHM